MITVSMIKPVLKAIGYLILAITIFFFGKKCSLDHYQKEKEELIDNLSYETKTFQDKEKQWHLKTRAMEIQSNETLQLLVERNNQFKDLQKDFQDLKMKKVKYIGSTISQTSIKLSDIPDSLTIDYTPNYTEGIGTHTNRFILPDSIAFGSPLSGSINTTKIFDYTEPEGWYDLEIVLSDKCAVKDVSIVNRDSVYAVVQTSKKLFKKREFKAEIVSKNPHTKIIASTQVIVNKKKGFFQWIFGR